MSNTNSHVLHLAIGVDLTKNLSVEKMDGVKQILGIENDADVVQGYFNFIIEQMMRPVAKQDFSVLEMSLKEMPSQPITENDQHTSVIEQYVPNPEAKYVDTEVSKKENLIDVEADLSDSQAEFISLLKAAYFEVKSAMGEVEKITVSNDYSSIGTPRIMQELDQINLDVHYEYLDVNQVGKFSIEYIDYFGNHSVRNEVVSIIDEEMEGRN